jgi:hypothetical protein
MTKKQNQAPPPALAKGQLWKLSHAYIEIVELGKRLLQYRMMTRPDERGARTLMSGVDTMWGYLRSRHAKLVEKGT